MPSAGRHPGKALARASQFARHCATLVEQGHPCPIVTGSGTGTRDFDHEFGLFTDLQVGSYVFSDVIYNSIEIGAGGDRPVLPALFVVSRVISRQHRDFATIDAGSKSFSMDGPMPVLWRGRRRAPPTISPVRRSVRPSRPHRC
ncbi:MAG: hypothetical protein IPM60_14145 [Rhodospirillales bacterium]|nr:hypothetical protein [Rhodospirillales bacterium]